MTVSIGLQGQVSYCQRDLSGTLGTLGSGLVLSHYVKHTQKKLNERRRVSIMRGRTLMNPHNYLKKHQ